MTTPERESEREREGSMHMHIVTTGGMQSNLKYYKVLQGSSNSKNINNTEQLTDMGLRPVS